MRRNNLDKNQNDTYQNNASQSNKTNFGNKWGGEGKKFLSHKLRLNLVKAAVVIAALLFFLAPMSSTIPQADMYSMVTAMGLDKGEIGIICTAEVVLPVENNGAVGTSIVLSGEGKTLSSAIENLCISLGRTLDLSHCAIIVLGQDLAKEGVMDELRFLLSSGNVSPQIGMVLSGNKNAKEFVKSLNSYGEKLDVENLLKYTNYGSHNYSQSLIEFLRHTYSKSESAVMPCIMMGEKADNMSAVEGYDFEPKQSKSDDNEFDESRSDKSKASEEGKGGQPNQPNQAYQANQASQSSEEGDGDAQTVIERTEKVGAFYKGKLRAVWGAREGNAVAWSDPKTKFGHIVMENIEYKDKSIDKLSCYLIKKKVKMSPSFSGEIPTLTFKIESHFMIEERFKLYELVDSLNAAKAKDVYPVIIAQLEDEIKEYIKAGLVAARRDGCDAYLINDQFYKHHNKQYKEYIGKGGSVLDSCELRFEFDTKIN